MPDVSVIIPLYNAASTLQRCLESVLRQDYTDFEVILVNDGSRDLSEIICKQFAEQDARFKCFKIENSGPSAARNLGLEKSLGKYICFVDSDDYVTENYISALRKPFDDHDIQLTFSGYYEVGGSTSYPFPVHDLKRFKKEYIDGKTLRRALLNGTSGIICGKMFVNEIIKKEQLNFCPKIRLHEDLLFLLKYSKNVEKTAVVWDYLYYYDRSNIHSLSAVRDENFLTSVSLVNDLIRKYYTGDDIDAIVNNRTQQAVMSYAEHISSKPVPRQQKSAEIAALMDEWHSKMQPFGRLKSPEFFSQFLLKNRLLNAFVVWRKIIRFCRHLKAGKKRPFLPSQKLQPGSVVKLPS